jgi:hypothetical protein
MQDFQHYPSLFLEAWGFMPSEANVRWFKALGPLRKRKHIEDMLDMVEQQQQYSKENQV